MTISRNSSCRSKRSTALTLALLAGAILGSMLLGSTAKADQYALLVGVTDYKKSGLNQLKYCENDVVELAEVLMDRGYEPSNVILLTGSKGTEQKSLRPNAKNIQSHLDKVLSKLTSRDNLIVAFTGHGVQFKDETESYFCPLDCNLDKRESLISIKSIYQQLEKSKAAGKILFVDACRNSPRIKTRGGRFVLEAVSDRVNPVLEGGTVAMFSCSGTQQSFEFDELQHGVFFYNVIEGLRGNADSGNDGDIDVFELQSYAGSRVAKYVSENTSETQTPAFKCTELQGKIILTRKLTDQAANANQKFVVEKFTNSIGMEFHRIPANSFLMGSPTTETGRSKHETPHEVEISNSFFIGIHEVTQSQWREIMNSEPWEKQENTRSGDNFPATHISWIDATEYCKQLGKKESTKYRLPTEAEWELACRGGETSPYSFGNDASILNRFSWWGAYYGNGNAKTAKFAHVVAQKRANPFGLFDMHGNVWEWCQDYYDRDYYSQSPAKNPVGPATGSSRVLRGGSWGSQAADCRSACRYDFPEDATDANVGFRVVLDKNKQSSNK